MRDSACFRPLGLAALLLLAVPAAAQTVEEDLAKIARIHREMEELAPQPAPPTSPGLVNPAQQRVAAERQYNALQADANARRNRQNQSNLDQALPGLENRQSLRGYDPQRADDFRRSVDQLKTQSPGRTPSAALQNLQAAPPGAPNSPASSDPQRRDDAQRAIDEQRFNDQRNRLGLTHP